MFNFSAILTDLRAAIAVVAARDPTLTALLVMVWGRIARMGAQLERLMAQWRAGTLPMPRAPRAAVERSAAPRAAQSLLPDAPTWLILLVRDAAPFASQLEHLMREPEFETFLAEVPQARRILRPLCRMLGIGVVAHKPWSPRPRWTTPDTRTPPVPAGLVLGPGGRMIYV